jgi:hypothetical protein
VSRLPHLPPSGNSTQWADVIVFLGILTLGGVLLTLGSATASSLGAVCAALGGLWAIYKWPRPPNGSSGADDPKSKLD